MQKNHCSNILLPHISAALEILSENGRTATINSVKECARPNSALFLLRSRFLIDRLLDSPERTPVGSVLEDVLLGTQQIPCTLGNIR